jgi:hypothetical protein
MKLFNIVAGFFVGFAVAIIAFGWDDEYTPGRKTSCDHAWGKWTNSWTNIPGGNLNVNSFGAVWQHRYCNNCGIIQNEDHR